MPAWGRSCGISDECTKCRVHFRSVSAAGLQAANLNETSDPFICFPRQLLLENPVQSKRIDKTLNPKWKNKHLPPLELVRNNLSFLERALLLFQIQDFNKLSANELIGCGFIEMRYCVRKLNKWVRFKRNLTFNGFMGELKLEYKRKKSRPNKLDLFSK